MIAVVTGGRDNWNVPDIEGVLGDFGPFTRLYHGGAQGADTVAARWADANGVPVKRVLPNWRAYGFRAGPIRNGMMLEAAKAEAESLGVPVKLFAFDGGKGTADCMRQAKAMGIAIVDCRFNEAPEPEHWSPAPAASPPPGTEENDVR